MKEITKHRRDLVITWVILVGLIGLVVFIAMDKRLNPFVKRQTDYTLGRSYVQNQKEGDWLNYRVAFSCVNNTDKTLIIKDIKPMYRGQLKDTVKEENVVIQVGGSQANTLIQTKYPIMWLGEADMFVGITIMQEIKGLQEIDVDTLGFVSGLQITLDNGTVLKIEDPELKQ